MTSAFWLLTSVVCASVPAPTADGALPPLLAQADAPVGASDAADPAADPSAGTTTDVDERPALLGLAIAGAGAGLAASAAAALVVVPYLSAVSLGAQIRGLAGIDLFVWQNGMVAALLGMLIATPALATTAAAAVALPWLGWRRGAAVAVGAAWGLTSAGTAAAVPLVLATAILTGLGIFNDVNNPMLQLGAGIAVGALIVAGSGLGALGGALFFPDEWDPALGEETAL